MLTRLTAPALILLVGCAEFPPQGEAVEIVPLGDDNDEEVAAAQVSWGEEGITLSLTNTSGMNFQGFGIAQNDATCQQEEELSVNYSRLGCWTGEDCIGGDVSMDGTMVFSDCHAVGTRSELFLEYVQDGIREAILENNNSVINGQTTAFPDQSYEFKVTYYLLEEDGRCWRWGLDTEYYAEQGCSNAN